MIRRLSFLRTTQLALTLACSSAAWPSLAALGGGVPAVTKDGQPNIRSAAAYVVDLGTGRVLFEREADTVRPIASISKLVSALVIHEECALAPDGLHEMSPKNRDAAKGGDKSKLTTGWRYSHRDLLHAALMRSDNRALPALGEACGLDIPTFAEKMNARVRRLGLVKTSFKEPNGLSVENVSTARETLTILREALKVPALVEIMGQKEYTLTAIKQGRPPRTIKIKNTDRLLTKNLAQILGGKTGYTDIARYCLAVAAKTHGGQELGMVFLGAEGRYTRFADFSRVISWINPQTPLQRELAVPAGGELPASLPDPGVQSASAAAATSPVVPVSSPAPATTPAGDGAPSL